MDDQAYGESPNEVVPHNRALQDYVDWMSPRGSHVLSRKDQRIMLTLLFAKGADDVHDRRRLDQLTASDGEMYCARSVTYIQRGISR